MSINYALRWHAITTARKIFHYLGSSKLPFKIFPSTVKSADQKNIKITFQAEPESFLLKKTNTQGKILPEIQTKNILFRPPPTWLAEGMDCGVCGPDVAVFTKTGGLLGDVSIAWENRLEHHPVFRSINLKRFKKINTQAVLLAVTGGGTYFHWMFEVLPRLQILKQANISPQEALYVVNSLKENFQRETLAKLGVNVGRCISLEENPALLFKKLFIPSYPCAIGAPSPAVVKFLRKELGGASVARRKCAPFPQRIYLDRKRGSRKVVCENHLKKKLEKKGFSFLDPGSFSFSEQVAIFSKADFIIAPHGAALSNIVFCRPGTKVVELFSGEYVNVCYQHLAGVCGLDHFSVHSWARGEKLRHLTSLDLSKNPSNITVRVQDVLEVLDQAGLN